MGRLSNYDTEQRLAIGTGAGLGVGGFALWIGLEGGLVWAGLGLCMLFLGGVVSGTGSVGFSRGIRDAVPAMGLILAGETVVISGVVAARPGTGGLEAILVGALGTVFLFYLFGAVVFTPFLLLAGLGGWIREKVSGPVEDDATAEGSAEPDDSGPEWRRADEY